MATQKRAMANGTTDWTATNAQLNLLDLLKFGHADTPKASGNASSKAAESIWQGLEATNSPGPTDVLNSGQESSQTARNGASKPPTPQRLTSRSTSTDHQESLLRLLNQGLPKQQQQTPTTKFATPTADSSTIPMSDHVERHSLQDSSKVIPSRTGTLPTDGMFTYINPFVQLSASSPLRASNISKGKNLDTPGDVIPRQAIGVERSSETEKTPVAVTGASAILHTNVLPEGHSSVAEALNHVGKQAHGQVEKAMVEAEKKTILNAQVQSKGLQDVTGNKEPEGAHQTIPSPLEKSNGRSTSPNISDEQQITTFQFPLKPFVSITIISKETPLLVQDDALIHIARFKKEFDQIDRTLAAASRDFIVYAMPKSGGVRLIRQDDGDASVLFSDTQDRIFNIALCTSASDPSPQRVVATGVSGTVYWATINPSNVLTDDINSQRRSLTIPPALTWNEGSSSGQLKTRAKKSSRHPDLFAIGRGKLIHILFPFHARQSSHNSKKGKLDTERYFTERNMKVNTGKANKDFAFSEDDTVMITLDKAGKLRLWDIRPLIVDENALESRLAPLEVKSPILTFATSATNEKSWPTSVLFVDKLRSYVKGIAQRYIIVGLKQNHTLQLWDLCLGKAVQELNFPHTSESDAVCSVVYHPPTGVIAVGHPTRNSVFLIHLSAPRYHLTPLSQAMFAKQLASNHTDLPRAESTAIMSGMREYSLSSIGQLRSLELAPGAERQFQESDVSPTLFELYIAHSKGVTCLTFSDKNIGWNAEYKPILPVDATTAGMITVAKLRDTSVLQQEIAAEAEPLSAQANGGPSSKTIKTLEKNKADKKKPKPSNPDETGISTKKVENLSKSDSIFAKASVSRGSDVLPVLPKQDVPKIIDQQPKTEALSSPHNNDSQISVRSEFQSTFQREFDALQRRLEADRSVQTATTAANQEAILKLVSTQLGDNVEKTLASIVTRSIQSSVTPLISSMLSVKLGEALTSTVKGQITKSLPALVNVPVKQAVSETLSTGEIVTELRDLVAKQLKDFAGEHITPFKDKVDHSTKLAATRIDKEIAKCMKPISDKLKIMEDQRNASELKIKELTSSVSAVSELLLKMAEEQSAMYKHITELIEGSQANEKVREISKQTTPPDHLTLEQQEAARITAELRGGRFEEAAIMWLRSDHQDSLFDQIFASEDKSLLSTASPLVVLSIGAAISGALVSKLEERLAWLTTVLETIDPSHPEVREVARKVFEMIGQRLQASYMRIAEEQPGSPALRQIAQLSRQSQELMKPPITL